MKTQLNEAIEMMEKLNLFEGSQPRIQVTSDELLNILGEQEKQGGNPYISLTYVKCKNVYKQKRSWKIDDLKNAMANYNDQDNTWFNTIKGNLDDEKAKTINGIDGIIVATRYNLHWISDTRFNKQYSDYKKALSDLRMKNGIAIQTDGNLGDNRNVKQKTDYGVTINQRGNLGHSYNMATMTTPPKSTCYLVNAEGHIVEEIPGEVMKAIVSPSAKRGGVEKSVRDVLSGEVLDAYAKAKEELDKSFKPNEFLLDNTLCMVATVNGKGYYFINDQINVPIAKGSDVKVNPQELGQIAREQLSKNFEKK